MAAPLRTGHGTGSDTRTARAAGRMETCVLLPQEFSLVLGAPADGDSKGHEAEVQVWSNARIPQGVRVYPFQGTVRLDKLDVLGYLSPTDVSTSGAAAGIGWEAGG